MWLVIEKHITSSELAHAMRYMGDAAIKMWGREFMKEVAHSLDRTKCRLLVSEMQHTLEQLERENAAQAHDLKSDVASQDHPQEKNGG